jgi:hypothetical protein
VKYLQKHVDTVAGSFNLLHMTKPMLTWEEIMKAAHKIAGVNGTDNVDRADAFLFACAVVYFDVAIKDGGTKLPASWKSAAVHAAGYEPAKAVR